MWLLVDVAGILSVTELHCKEDVGHTHLEGEEGGGGGGGGGRREGQGLSCVDTNHFMLPPGVCVWVWVFFSAVLCRRKTRTSGTMFNHRCLMLSSAKFTSSSSPFLSIASLPHTLSCWLTIVDLWCAMQCWIVHLRRMQRWYCHPADQLPSILNKSSHISRTGVPLPLNDSHKSKSIDYTIVGLWELELMQAALWLIYAYFPAVKISRGRASEHTTLDQLVLELKGKYVLEQMKSARHSSSPSPSLI